MTATATGSRADAAGLPAWFEEFRRLVAEAEERFNAGDVRPALASLAAIPPVHRVLVEGCGDLLEDPNPEVPVDDGHLGLYL